MTQQHPDSERFESAQLDAQSSEQDSPEALPPKAWATLVLFAAFVVAFGTCASTFMFN